MYTLDLKLCSPSSLPLPRVVRSIKVGALESIRDPHFHFYLTIRVLSCCRITVLVVSIVAHAEMRRQFALRK